jgi:hypothetical protein
MENWSQLVRRTGRIEEIGARLDSLGHDERVAAVRSMTAKTLPLLWELSEGTTVTLRDLVPDSVPPLTQVIHFGKNSLPAFTSFEKRFCRPSPGCNEELLYGYNEGVTRPLVGPGYFVVRETPNSLKGKTVVDYYGTPSEKPAGWPEIASTDWGIPAAVYGFMHDYLRKVSEHVTVGRAYKFHKPTNAYFLLCRQANV